MANVAVWVNLAVALLLLGVCPSSASVSEWFAGTTWRGSFETVAYFSSNSTLFASCGSNAALVPNVSLAFGADGSAVTLNVTMPPVSGQPFPGVATSVMDQIYSGRMEAQVLQKLPSTVGGNFEQTVLLRPKALTQGSRLRSGDTCVKLQSRTLSGGFPAIRYLEAGGVSNGQFVWNCPSTESTAQCFGQTQVNVIRAFPFKAAWHAEPWSSCSLGSNKTRVVSCRDEYGSAMHEDSCDAETRPAAWAACSTVAVPSEISGSWVGLLHAYDAIFNDTETALAGNKLALVVVDLLVSDNATAVEAAATAAGLAPPASLPAMVLRQEQALLADPARDAAHTAAMSNPPGILVAGNLADAAFQNQLALGYKAPRRVAAAPLTGAAASAGSSRGGRVEGWNTTGTPIALAFAPAASSGSLGTLGLSAGSSGIAITWTPELASSASAFGAVGRRARGRFTSDASAQAAMRPSTAVLSGIATRGPTSYLLQPLGGCVYDGAQNRARCGGGSRTRSVACLDATNATVSDAQCIALLGPKPATGGSCNQQSCAEYSVGSWSGCSKPCGDGVQTRSVTCVDLTGTVTASRCLAESVLYPGGAPTSSRACNNCACQNAGLAFNAHVRSPLTAPTPATNLSQAGKWSALTADKFCPPGQELLKVSEWRCFPAAATTDMCSRLNAAAAPHVLPFAFKAEDGESLTAPRFLPRPATGSAAPNVKRVKADASCALLGFDYSDSAFADPSRQAAVGACRAKAA
ncbi:hypothetical protein FNF29_00484 [Cafeteria roenbergensis]|uniref:Uncharacterized protein n=1 Tax=Cafeteria roenbergensis TaxID=33653 RepID=A0A5A8CVE7_CAFRO|nr:hypothetical protein FNF29_00484 [Cafeteria roenbergensis]|eukprot:KAA0157132.1 hypothetical protein FNF29_00484 [Cafeteria roenbergensis]